MGRINIFTKFVIVMVGLLMCHSAAYAVTNIVMTAEDMALHRLTYDSESEQYNHASYFTVPPGIDNPGDTLVGLMIDTDLDPKNYWYAMDYKDPDGNEDTLFSGKLTIKKSVRDERV